MLIWQNRSSSGAADLSSSSLWKDGEPEEQDPDPLAELSVQSRPPAFHVRPVPIDHPLSEA
jgi:hypothetical protein